MFQNFTITVLFSTMCFFTLSFSQTKVRKLESKVNILQNKLEMLENKVYEDELNFQDDIDTILRQLNTTDCQHQTGTSKTYPVNHASTNNTQLLNVLEKLTAFRDGFGKEKQNIRDQLNMFEDEFDLMKQEQTKSISVFVEKSNEIVNDVDNKVTEGRELLGQLEKDMGNEISLIKQNLSAEIESSNVAQQGIEQAVAELYHKISNIESEIKKTKKAVFLECGTWDRYGLSCYKLFKDTVVWKEAVARCKTEDAYLAEIDSSAENSFLVNFLKTKGVSVRPWLGASDLENEGKWIWEYSGRILDKGFQNWGKSEWADSEPNGNTSENCLNLHEHLQLKWNDETCDDNLHYLCEKPVTVVEVQL